MLRLFLQLAESQSQNFSMEVGYAEVSHVCTLGNDPLCSLLSVVCFRLTATLGISEKMKKKRS